MIIYASCKVDTCTRWEKNGHVCSDNSKISNKENKYCIALTRSGTNWGNNHMRSNEDHRPPLSEHACRGIYNLKKYFNLFDTFFIN